MKLEINLENCYGIKKLEKVIDLTENNTSAIYAKNASMKTSFAKVFKKIQEGKEKEICDEIFGNEPVKTEIKVNGEKINKDEIFVINSFESNYESENISTLLINDDLKQKLSEVEKLKVDFFKLLNKKSGIAISSKSGGVTSFPLETILSEVLEFDEHSFLLNIPNINIGNLDYDFSDVKYLSIFDKPVIKKIKSDTFQKNIDEYLKKSDEIYSSYGFLEKGQFTLPKLKDVLKNLKAQSFFVKDNALFLGEMIPSEKILDEKIKAIEKELITSDEFKDIEKYLSDVNGRVLKDVIENYPDIVQELKLENLEKFKKKLCLSYIASEEEAFNILKQKYLKLHKHIEEADLESTPWKEALEIFENRFTMPFKMEIDNPVSSIIGVSVPKVKFSFFKDGDKDNISEDNMVTFDREEIEAKNTLSQGEKRALYLLNIIFDIETRKRLNKKTLFIIDDIADSFDYKNKYAIIEYLKDISDEPEFYVISLTHNFDFHRTVSSRLDVKCVNRLNALLSADSIELKQEKYQGVFFKTMLEEPCEKYTIALIPFIRNLIEYGVDREANDFKPELSDYKFLTKLLHVKDDTSDILMKNLTPVFEEYVGKEKCEKLEKFICDPDLPVIEKIYNLADNITDDQSELEDKLILSMAIRLKAEEHMIEKIKLYDKSFTWSKGEKTGGSDKALAYAYKINQTRRLFNLFKQISPIDSGTIRLLESVNIMTPENIHVNTFMYEPILDMDIVELRNLYANIKSLGGNDV